MKARLRILEVSPFYAPAPAYGGIPVVLSELSEALSARGHKVHVLTTDVFTQSSRRPDFPGTEGGPNVHSFRNFSNALAYRFQVYTPSRRALKTFFQKTLQETDLVHIHAHRHALSTLSARAARAAGLPYVVQAHGTVLPIERRILAKRFYDVLWGDAVLKSASGFVAVAEAELEQYRKKGVSPSRVRVIPNGLDTKKFTPLPKIGTFRKAWGLPEGAPFVLYAGKITPRKGADVLVEAFARKSLPADAWLVLAGADMGPVPSLRRRIIKLGLTRRSLITGTLSWRELLSAYVDADVTVYPSTLEIFGLVPFESLLAGTPVIVSDDCGCGDLVKKARAGMLVPYGDAPALASAIRETLSQPEKTALQVKRGQDFIRTRLNWEKVSEEFEHYFYEILQKNEKIHG